MSARAIASQKAKRAGGQSDQSKQNKPSVVQNEKNNSDDTKKQTITFVEALNMLRKRIDVLEENKHTIPQPDLIAEFAKHLNDIESKITTINNNIKETQNKVKELNDKITMNTNNLLLHKKDHENVLQHINNQNNKNKSLDEIQALVNVLSSKILNNNNITNIQENK